MAGVSDITPVIQKPLCIMKKEQLKPILRDFLKGMCNEWFEDRNLLKTLGNALIEANVNKYDNILSMFENDEGDIDVNSILSNMEPIQIDLSKYSPLLPQRILLITKEDIDRLLKDVNQGQEGYI